MIIAQQFRALSVDGVNNVAVEKVSCYETCKNLSNLFRIIAALHQAWKKFMLMKVVNGFYVGEYSVLLAAQGFRNFFPIENVHVVCYAGFQGSHVIFFVLQKLTNDVE